MKRLWLLGLCLLLASPAWASEEIGRQEDTANADGQVLMPVGCVRQDAIASSTSTDGDYGNIKCNNVGRAYTSATIDAALPTGTNAIGKLSSNTGVDIGSVGILSIAAGNNNIGDVDIASIIPGTGTTSLGKAEDASHVSGDTGVSMLCVRHDTSTTGLGVDGDYAACGLDANGRLYTNSDTELPAAATLADNTANPSLSAVAAYLMCFDGTTWDRCLPGLSDTDDDSIAFSQLTSLVLGAQYVSDGSSWIRRRAYLEDVAEVGGMQLNMAGSVRRDTMTSSAGTTGDNATVNTDGSGLLWTRTADPCSALSKIFIPISQTTGTQLFTGTASNRTYVCSIHVVSATAQNIALVSGTGTVCATSTGPMAGGTTAATGWNFAANGGLVLGNGSATVAKSDTDADNICILMSSVGQLSGTLSYVVAPN